MKLSPKRVKSAHYASFRKSETNLRTVVFDPALSGTARKLSLGTLVVSREQPVE